MRAASNPNPRRAVRGGLFAVLLAMVAPLPTYGVETEVKVIALKHRLPDEVLPALRPLLAGGESISGYGDKLIVRASPHTLVQLEKVLVDLDAARRNLRISVRLGGARASREHSLGVSGSQQLGSTRIVVTGPQRPGVTNVGRGDGAGLSVDGETRLTATRAEPSSFLLVQDGGHGLIQVGQSIPTVQPYLALAGPRLAVFADIRYYDVTTGFEVEPRLLGEQVLLRISPRLTFRSSRGAETVEFRELRTEVTVKPGEWVDLGGVVGSANEVNRQILSRRHETAADDERFLVKIDPL